MDDDLVNVFDPSTGKWKRVPKTPDAEPGAIAKGTVLGPITKTMTSIGAPESDTRVPAYRGGSVRSVQTLNTLRFDPIEQLVGQYRKLEAELLWYEQLREGTTVFLKPSGKPYVYNYDAHMRVHERLESIGSQLLRYGYGRVPESLDLNVNRPSKLVINLSKKGEKFEINNKEDESNGD